MSLESKETSNKEVKSARTVNSNHGRRRSKSRMPNVRGGSSPGKDSVSGLRLSRVSKGDSTRRIGEVGERDERVRESNTLTGVERQIAKLNAYRSLLKKKITLKGVPDDIHNEIINEHRDWIESQVMVMLGQGSSKESIRFSDKEIIILKQMAERVENKLNHHTKATERPIGPPAQNPVPQVPPAQQPESQQPILSESARNAQPLIPPHKQQNRMNMSGPLPNNSQIVEAARRLEAMDADSPNF